MGVCTCTSPDGNYSTTYEFDDGVPYNTDCERACRNWSSPTLTYLYPYGSEEWASRRRSCKMWVKDCGSGPDWITESEPRTQCVAGDSIGGKLLVDQGHGMGQYVDIGLKVLRASDEIVDYAPDGTPKYAGVEGPTKIIENPDSPFYGQEVKTCMVNGFDNYIYQVTRQSSSNVIPIAETSWGDVDVSTGAEAGQLAVPVFVFRKYGENVRTPGWAANYALNRDYDPEAICSVEDYFDITGETWETMPGIGGDSACDAKMKYLLYEGLGSYNELIYLRKSIADYELGCRIELGELLPETDFNEMYNANFSENKMWTEYDEVSSECALEDDPYDINAYCALYHWNWQNDGVCEGYDVENNPLGTAWWSGTSNSFGSSDFAEEYDALYADFLRNYFVNEQGIDSLANADDETLLSYANFYTNNQFNTSPEGVALALQAKARKACVVSKMYERYPNQFDWRGAFSPSNVTTGYTLLPDSMVGAYDWFNEDDVTDEGQIVSRTYSPTANEYGYETVDIPEGFVKMDYIEIPFEGQDEVAEFRGTVEVDPDINDARASMTDDIREPEGVFLPEDLDVPRIAAEEDLIESIEAGQLSDEDLKSLFTDESADAVSNMFEEVENQSSTETETEGQETEDEETIFDDGETDGEIVDEDSFDGSGDPIEEEDSFTDESSAEGDVQDEPMDVIEEEVILEVAEDEIVPEMATTTVVEDVMDVETLDDGVEKSGSIVPSSLKEAFQKPAVQAIAVACGIGLVAYFALGRKK